MPQYNILIACDQKYYETWAIKLLNSLKFHAPWLSLHCHLVNCENVSLIEGVNYTQEQITFVNDDQRLGYLQAVRFLAVADKFKNNESVITLDCDSICSNPFTEKDFASLFEKQYVLQHVKDGRWLAGFVTFKDNNFRQFYAEKLRSLPIEQWPVGWDQTVMEAIAVECNFVPLDRKWMSVGKYKNNSYFLTLKGTQKYKDKYLLLYNKFFKKVNSDDGK